MSAQLARDGEIPFIRVNFGMSPFAAYRLSIVPAWRASPGCLLSGSESEPTEFRFGSDCDIGGSVKGTDSIRSTRTPVLLCQNFPDPYSPLEIQIEQSRIDEALVNETEMSKAEAGRTINALVAIITKTVAKKEDVQLIGFGTFKATKRAARKGKNPRSGEALKIAAATVPKFTAGAAFKAAVNKKK
jgi:DNA-binding protein HU-beta